jgi:ribosomal protein L32
MAVPKKKTSKTKSRKRCFQWRAVAAKAAEKALSLAAKNIHQKAAKP